MYDLPIYFTRCRCPVNLHLALALFLLVPVLAQPIAASSLPSFQSPAAARAWGERAERAGEYQLAGEAFLREADLRARMGDPQGGEAQRRRAYRLLTDLALAVSVPASAPTRPLARLEPPVGCYLGVLDETAGAHLGNADNFERRVGRPVAVAFNYDTYGRPFPLAWARAQAERGRAIQIAWEPQQGLGVVRDDAYLNHWAADAARCGTSVFLRFGGEMNGGWTVWGRNPVAYRRAFRLVHKVVNRHASNVAMVWAPNAVPFTNVGAYYPGDDAVDWVGISLYVVRFYDDNLSRPAWGDHPLGFIAPFYQKYAARKPFCLVECGITRRSRVEGRNADGFAAARIQDLFDAIRVRFPRLKMVCWFDRNNLTGASPARRLNDYALPPGSLALQAWQNATADPYFLGRLSDRPTLAYQRLGDRLPFGYSGQIIGSLVTYSLDSTLEITRGNEIKRLPRPFHFFPPPGSGPITVRVRDPLDRTAATVRLTPQ